MKKITFLFLFITFYGYSQVGVGTTAPDATLDIVATNPTGASTAVDGILIPRVDRQRAQSMTGTITSTMIYVNSIATGTATGTAVNITSTGFYFYDGTVWQKIATGASTDWALTGNTGTTAGTNYIGTNDVQDFVVKTSAIVNTPLERMRVTTAGNVGINAAVPTTTALLTINPNTNAIRSGIDMTLTNATSAATGLNISAGNAFVNGITVTHSSASTSASLYGIGGVLSSTNIVSGFNAYRNGSGLSYGIYGINGTTGAYATNANTWAAFLQGRTVVSSESSPTSSLGTDLEIRNTTVGAAAPATVSLRQTTSLATSGNVLSNLNFGDNYITTPQAQIQVLRDAAASSSADMPTAMTFSTTTDASAALTEKMRITNAGDVGIGTTPNASAKLDISATNKGLLIPRVALTSATDVLTVAAPITSLLVYNTGAAGLATPGYFYWNGARWIAFTGSGGNDWSITGNAGTTAANYVGTSDAVDFKLATNGTERIRVLQTTGQVVVNNTGAPAANDRFSVYNTTTSDRAIVGYSTLTGTGVRGENTGTGYGVYGNSANNGYGVTGANNSNGIGVFGSNTSTGWGVYGQNNSTGFGVRGYNSGTGLGVYGTSINGTGNLGAGVYGNADSATGVGVFGSSIGATGTGVWGNVTGNTGIGVYGQSTTGTNGTGVFGYATGTGSDGIYGESTAASRYGVWGVNNNATGYGVRGSSTGTSGTGVYGNSSGTSGFGVYGLQTQSGRPGVYGINDNAFGYGVQGTTTGSNGNGVYGIANGSSGYGVYGTSSGLNAFGVVGTTTGTNGYGVMGTSTGTNGVGVYGNENQAGRIGVLGINNNATGIGTSGQSTGATGVGVTGITSGIDGTGIIGSSTGTNADGVYGQATGATGYGVWGVNNNITGNGVVGTSTGTTGTGIYGNTTGSDATAVVGISSGANADGVYGQASGATGYGVYGINNNATGYAIVGTSTGTSGVGLYGSSSGATGNGVIGINTNTTGTGIIGAGNNAGGTYLGAGSGGAFNGNPYGTVSWGRDTTTGIGVAASGNGEAITTIGATGAGGAFTGNKWALTGIATITGAGNDATDRGVLIGNYVSGGSTIDNVYVGARIAGVNYKILGTGGGSVSTTMKTSQGERILFAPEATENWFFDMGEVELVNGKATVILDPLFVETLSDSKPFKVFVQGGENTLGSIRITRNQENKSFVVEDLGGASNGIVQYSIYGIWKGKENLRLPELKEENKPKQKVFVEKNVSFNKEKIDTNKSKIVHNKNYNQKTKTILLENEIAKKPNTNAVELENINSQKEKKEIISVVEENSKPKRDYTPLKVVEPKLNAKEIK